MARHKGSVAAVLFVLAVVVYPLAFPDPYHIGVGISAGAMAVSTVGLVLLLGLAHQLAIGQAAFSMIGGYANGILCVRYGWDPFLAMTFGAAVAMLAGWAVAAPILKLRGFVLAMATLALHLMLIVAAIELPFTGGPIGVTGIPKFRFLGLPLSSDLSFYFFAWLMALGAVWIGLNIDRSRIGQYLAAASLPAGDRRRLGRHRHFPAQDRNVRHRCRHGEHLRQSAGALPARHRPDDHSASATAST